MMHDLNTDQKGHAAERIAVWFLRFKGYRILARRFKTKIGEIDVVACRGNLIAFIEVKYRAQEETALAAIDTKSQMRIRRAAELYLQRHPEYHGYNIRFDAVTIVGRLSWIVSNIFLWPQHHKNVF